jgi:hypothetical protein
VVILNVRTRKAEGKASILSTGISHSASVTEHASPRMLQQFRNKEVTSSEGAGKPIAVGENYNMKMRVRTI